MKIWEIIAHPTETEASWNAASVVEQNALDLRAAANRAANRAAVNRSQINEWRKLAKVRN